MEPRPLDQDDFVRMNLPKDLRNCEVKRVPGSILCAVSRYADSVDEMIREGAGLLLYGPAGVGKSGAAAALAKVARSHRHPVYFVAVGDLQECTRSKIPFDEDQSVLGRCDSVDLLILDDLTELDIKDPVFGARMLDRLLRTRTAERRSTIITTQLDLVQLWALLPQAMERLGPRCVFLAVTGPNLRLEETQALRTRLLAPK
jgi:DNA replication protein DnaC